MSKAKKNLRKQQNIIIEESNNRIQPVQGDLDNFCHVIPFFMCGDRSLYSKHFLVCYVMDNMDHLYFHVMKFLQKNCYVSQINAVHIFSLFGAQSNGVYKNSAQNNLAPNPHQSGGICASMSKHKPWFFGVFKSPYMIEWILTSRVRNYTTKKPFIHS